MADIQEVSFSASGTDVTLTTTSEIAVITSPLVAVPRQTVFAMIIAHAQVETGAGTTHVTPRVKRGSDTSGSLVIEGRAEDIKVAAEGEEPSHVMVGEELSDLAEVQYTLTLQQTASTGNGTVRVASILVFLI